jgi:hypothetical protein
LFFRIELLSFGSLSTSPHVPGLIRDGQFGLCLAGLIFRRTPATNCLLRVPSWIIMRLDHDPRGNLTPARAGQKPDARDSLMRATLPAAVPQAAQARAIPHGSLDTPVMLRLSPHSFSPSDWSGECIAASAAPSARRIPPPTPTPEHETHCPPTHWHSRFMMAAPSGTRSAFKFGVSAFRTT